MTGLIYVVKIRELIPASLPRKPVEAHIKALKSAQRQEQKQRGLSLSTGYRKR